MFGMFESRRRRRERLRSEPFPDAWEATLRRNAPLYGRLPEDDRRELRGHIRVFLAEKRFEGCGGLELTDEIKVTIAAQACLLLLHRETDYYPRLITILVYPSTCVAHARQPIGGGVVLEGEVARLGEAWKDGVVVLAWDDVLAGASGLHDGHNVVLHEFAHQFDREDGTADGAPGARTPEPLRHLGTGAQLAVGLDEGDHVHVAEADQPSHQQGPMKFVPPMTSTFIAVPRRESEAPPRRPGPA